MSSPLVVSARYGRVSSKLSWRQAVILLAAIMVLGVAYGPLLHEFCEWQLRREHYGHFFVMPVLAAILFAFRAAVAGRHERLGSRWPFYTFVIASWLVLLAAHVLYSPLLAAVSAILLAGGGVSAVTSRRTVPYAWGTWALLWLALPLPLGRDQMLMAKLQQLSSQLGSIALDYLGVLHVMDGNTLSLASRQLFVDEACSGIMSLLMVVNLAIFYGVLLKRSALHVGLLGLAGVAWAVLWNVARIVTIACFLDWWQVDLSSGSAHTALGITTLALAIAGVAATDPLVSYLLAPIAAGWEDATGSEVRFGRHLVAAWDRVAQWGDVRAAHHGFPDPNVTENEPEAFPTRPAPGSGLWIAASFALLAPLGLLLPAKGPPALAGAISEACVERALRLDETHLPHVIAGARFSALRYVRRDRLDQFGEHSATYDYRHVSGTPLLISCDFPFRGGWHELSICYQGSGWELVDRKVHAVADGEGESWNYVAARFRRHSGEHAAVVYSAFTSEGTPIAPPGGTFGESLKRALSRRRQPADEGLSFQVQVLAQGPVAFSDERLHELCEAHLIARERFRQHLIGPSAANSNPRGGQ